jgi:hypothetical protein
MPVKFAVHRRAAVAGLALAGGVLGIALPGQGALAAGRSTAAPRSLAGTWHVHIGGVDQKLAFSGHIYRVYVTTDDVAQGRIAVHGHLVTLFGSNTCSGHGTYSWHVRHGVLRLRSHGKDPCPRSMLLPGHAWRRVRAHH